MFKCETVIVGSDHIKYVKVINLLLIYIHSITYAFLQNPNSHGLHTVKAADEIKDACQLTLRRDYSGLSEQAQVRAGGQGVRLSRAKVESTTLLALKTEEEAGAEEHWLLAMVRKLATQVQAYSLQPAGWLCCILNQPMRQSLDV